MLKRRPGEAILIGDDIEIRVIEVGPNRVKLGISAPAAVSVQRQEALVVRRQNLAAAGSLGDGRLLSLMAGARSAASKIRQAGELDEMPPAIQTQKNTEKN